MKSDLGLNENHKNTLMLARLETVEFLMYKLINWNKENWGESSKAFRF